MAALGSRRAHSTMRRRHGGNLSSAERMSRREREGLFIDFSDFSARVKSDSSLSMRYNSVGRTDGNGNMRGPSGLLALTGTAKLTRQQDGVWRFQPHNIYVNSATPANQSITVVSGADYAVTITDSVSVTASGAATGTWTAGTTTFTAATATLTLGSTSGSGTVHVRRTPSDSRYVATGASPKYGFPFEWDTNGVNQGALIEIQATNLFLNSTTGATQTITVSNATAYVVSFFGTGSITFSGANSSTLSGTGASDRVQTTFTTASTSLTCTVTGSISYVQVELGTVATSPIITYGASATRTGDLPNIATSLIPYSNGCPMTMGVVVSPPNGTSLYPLTFPSGTLGLRRLNTNVPRLDNNIGGAGHVTYGSSATGTYSQVAASASGDQALCINGGAVSTNSWSYSHTGFTQLNIGALAVNSEAVRGYLKKAFWVPRKMSAAEIKSVSSL